uniref:Uncharacterized protein n=1 Tax=Acrobeloides nanus TaxID=290746 RepID=A0A914CQQ6_9BILA
MGDLNSSCNHITVYTPVVSCFDEDEVCYMECARNGTVVKRDCSKDDATSTSRRTCNTNSCNTDQMCTPEVIETTPIELNATEYPMSNKEELAYNMTLLDLLNYFIMAMSKRTDETLRNITKFNKQKITTLSPFVT